MLRKSTVIYIYILVVEVLIVVCLSIDPDTARWLSTLLSGLFVGTIALFHPRIWNYFTQPRLNIVLRLTPPDCHRTEMQWEMETGKHQLPIRAPCYYFRFRIYNYGESLAKDVEVVIEELWLRNIDTGQFAKDETFLPLDLVWSHIRTITQNIQPFGVFKFCDLGYIIHGEPLFHFDFFLQPFARPNFVREGTYKIKVTASASNSRPTTRWFKIQWTGKWAEEEKDMFAEDCITIEPTTAEK